MKKYIAGTMFIAVIAVLAGMWTSRGAVVAHAEAECLVGQTQMVGGDCQSCFATDANNSGNGSPGFWVSSDISNCMFAITAGGAAAGSVAVSLTGSDPVFTWSVVPGAAFYKIQISRTSNFSDIFVEKNRITTNSYRYSSDEQSIGPAEEMNIPEKKQKNPGLAVGQTYYWRVFAGNNYGLSSPSTTFAFRVSSNVSNAPGLPIQGGSGPIGPAPTLVSYCNNYACFEFLDDCFTDTYNNEDHGNCVAARALTFNGGSGAPVSAYSTENIFSLFSAIGAQWVDASGTVVHPTSVSARTEYFDEKHNKVVPLNDAARKIISDLKSISHKK